jgi:hypothetical protein
MNHQESSILTRMHRSSVLSAIQRSLAAGAVLFAASNAWAFQSGAGTGTGGAGGAGSIPTSAPEINPALIWGAVVLLVGGVLIFTSRRHRAANASKS